MIHYDIAASVEAYSTEAADCVNFSVVAPLRQAHGTKTIAVNTYEDIPKTDGADALITNVPGLRIAVKTADCVPVLLYDPNNRCIGAVHSGWKGTLADICGKCVRELTKVYGTSPADLRALIGPCIHVESFEVGDELYEQFHAEGYTPFAVRMNLHGKGEEKWHIDLPRICAFQLQRSGVKNVMIREECTYTLFPRFYSARRMKGTLGHHRILNCICML